MNFWECDACLAWGVLLEDLEHHRSESGHRWAHTRTVGTERPPFPGESPAFPRGARITAERNVNA